MAIRKQIIEDVTNSLDTAEMLGAVQPYHVLCSFTDWSEKEKRQLSGWLSRNAYKAERGWRWKRIPFTTEPQRPEKS
jgi:hypothetical protein